MNKERTQWLGITYCPLLLVIVGLTLSASGCGRVAYDRGWVENAVCGNGVLESDEQCDDGEANSDTLSDACRTNCLGPRCGDAVLDSGELCDDGNVLPGDGCSANCT